MPATENDESFSIWDSVQLKEITTKQVISVGSANAINSLYRILDLKETVSHSLQFQYKNIIDDEELLARIGYYSLVSPASSALLDLVISASKDIMDCLIIIVLDWSASPSQLMRDLQTMLDIIYSSESIKRKGNESGIETFIKNYKDPTNELKNASDINNLIINSKLLLHEGSLTQNPGVPIQIICTNSESISTSGQSLKDLDFIQQCLRIVALSIGSGLNYLNTTNEYCGDVIKRCIMHRLMHDTDMKFEYAFNDMPDVTKRDMVMVPAGWDSIPKIKLLDPDIPGTIFCSDSRSQWMNELLKTYSERISDRNSRNDQGGFSESVFEPLDEQVFLSRYTTLLKNETQSTLDHESKLIKKLKDSKENISDAAKKVIERTNPTGSNKNEVLSNFFQSLLQKKPTGGSGITNRSSEAGSPPH